MTHVTCRVTKDDIAPIFELTAKNRDQLRNPTLGNRVWAGYLYLFYANMARHVHDVSLVLQSSGMLRRNTRRWTRCERNLIRREQRRLRQGAAGEWRSAALSETAASAVNAAETVAAAVAARCTREHASHQN